MNQYRINIFDHVNGQSYSFVEQNLTAEEAIWNLLYREFGVEIFNSFDADQICEEAYEEEFLSISWVMI